MSDRETLEKRLLECHAEAGWGDEKGTICSCGDDKPCPEEADIRSVLERLEDAERPLEELRVERGLPENFSGDEIKSAVSQIIEGLEGEVERLRKEKRDVAEYVWELNAECNLRQKEIERLRERLEYYGERLRAEVADTHQSLINVRGKLQAHIETALAMIADAQGVWGADVVKALKGRGSDE